MAAAPEVHMEPVLLGSTQGSRKLALLIPAVLDKSYLVGLIVGDEYCYVFP